MTSDARVTNYADGGGGDDTRREPVGSAWAPFGAAQQSSSILVLAAWLGLFTGGVEGCYWLWRQQMFGDMVFMHPNFLWMAPATQLTLFAALGAVLAVVPWFVRSREAVVFAASMLLLVAWLNLLLLLVNGLQFWAWILFASGLATATGRVFRKHMNVLLRVVRRTTPLLLLATTTVAVVQEIAPRLHEENHVVALPDAPPDAPNVLLLVLDTVRADAVGFAGGESGLTPNLDRLAQQGVVFSRAWSTAPWTLPSMAGMFTGRLPQEISADWLSKLNGDYPTIAEALAARGWLTGGFVGNTRYCSAETGLARGFGHYQGYRYSWADFLLCTSLGRKFLCSPLPMELGWYDAPGRKRAAEVNESFLAWLDRRGGRPYFAFLNYWDAHDPYFLPPEWADSTSHTDDQRAMLRTWWWTDKQDVAPEDVRFLKSAYEDCLHELDRQLGRLLDELQRRGDLDNTLIVVTADHGEHFGDHGLYLHGNSLYEPLLHVPLLLVWPERLPQAERVDTPVSLQGLGATILDLLGQEPELPGSSFAEGWRRDATTVRRPQRIVAEIASQAGFPPCHGRSPVAAGPMQCARIGGYKYIINGDGRKELYNLEADPGESTNLAGTDQEAQILELFSP